jgi:hypothetical protein
MGTTSSTVKSLGCQAEVKVDLDNALVYPGSQVTGKAYLVVNADQLIAASLVLRISGGENVTIRFQNTAQQQPLTRSQVWIEVAVPLAVARDGFFARGQYVFPFFFIIPKGVPPSMVASSPMGQGTGKASRFGGDCSVSYTVEAKIQTSQQDPRFSQYGAFPFQDIGSQQIMTVLGKPPPDVPRTSVYVDPVEFHVNNSPFDCFSVSGNVRFGFAVPSNQFAVGETLDVTYVIQNNSNMNIASKGMELQLVEEVRYGINLEATASTRTLLLTKRFVGHELEIDRSEAFNPQDSVVSSRRRSCVITHPEISSKLKEIVDSRRYRYQFQVPPTAKSSMEGKLIQVEHYLKMFIHTGGEPLGIQARVFIHSPGGDTAAALSPRRAENEQEVIIPTAVTLSSDPSPASQQIHLQTAIMNDWQQHPQVAGEEATSFAVVAPSASAISLPSVKIMDSTTSSREVAYNVAPSGKYSSGGAESQEGQLIQNNNNKKSDQPVAELFQTLSRSYHPSQDFDNWCHENKADSLTADEFGMVFSMLGSDQVAIADQLVAVRTEISCAHIASALGRCSSIGKSELVKKLSVRCPDKDNIDLIQVQLSPYEWMCVENCFA